MSNNQLSPISDAEISAVQLAICEVAVIFALWGLGVSLSSCALYLLHKRGLRNSRSRQALSAIVLMVFLSFTANAILTLEFTVVQIPSLGTSTPLETVHTVTAINLASAWFIRFNLTMSDVIVVWRAWSLWPGYRGIQWMLGSSLGITIASTAANIVLVTIEHLQRVPGPVDSSGRLYGASTTRALLYVPLLATNTIATILICYKAWCYRREISDYTTAIEHGSSSSSSVKIVRLLALFVETGVVYIAFFVLNMVCAYGAFDRLEHGPSYVGIWAAVMSSTTALYPTAIIILVSLYMSQRDVIYTARPSSGDRNEPTRPLSTIQFNAPQLATNTSAMSVQTNGYEHATSRLAGKEKATREVV